MSKNQMFAGIKVIWIVKKKFFCLVFFIHMGEWSPDTKLDIVNMLVCITLICDSVYSAICGFYITHVWIVLFVMGQLILTYHNPWSVNTVSGNHDTFMPHYTTVLDLWSCAVYCGPSSSQYHWVRICCLIGTIRMEGGASFVKFGTTIPYCQSVMPFSFIFLMECLNESILCMLGHEGYNTVVSHIGYRLQILISSFNSPNS